VDRALGPKRPSCMSRGRERTGRAFTISTLRSRPSQAQSAPVSVVRRDFDCRVGDVMRGSCRRFERLPRSFVLAAPAAVAAVAALAPTHGHAWAAASREPAFVGCCLRVTFAGCRDVGCVAYFGRQRDGVAVTTRRVHHALYF
jgi:hypothetical protein